MSTRWVCHPSLASLEVLLNGMSIGGINGCALQAAAYRGHLKIVDVLLGNKADVNLAGTS